MIIGSHGKDIRTMMEEYDVSIAVPPSEEQQDTITITGTAKNCEEAKEALQRRVKQLDAEKEERVSNIMLCLGCYAIKNIINASVCITYFVWNVNIFYLWIVYYGIYWCACLLFRLIGSFPSPPPFSSSSSPLLPSSRSYAVSLPPLRWTLSTIPTSLVAKVPLYRSSVTTMTSGCGFLQRKMLIQMR